MAAPAATTPATSLAYRLLTRVGTALVPGAGLALPKVRASVAGRRGAVERVEAWAGAHRDPARPLAWFHAPSVGEGLQALAVLERVRRRHPDWQVAYTHFSPSAAAFAARTGADVHDYLPWDTPAAAERMLDALRPAVLVFGKLDLWPELATRAARRGVPVALVAATVREGSGRLRWPVRSLLRPGYAAVSAAAAIANDDAARLADLGVPRAAITVTGDTRYDSVIERRALVRDDDPVLALARRGPPALVAGSTWPADEDVLLGAFATVRRQAPGARLIVAPHEPTPDHLALLDQRAVGHGLPAPVRLGAATGGEPLLAVDRVGVLAALYGAGMAAYVGGGFGTAGLHSVLEPAAWGLPVAFGPRWRGSRDAGLLLEAGAGHALPQGPAAAEALAALWLGWLGDEAARAAQGRRAASVVESGRGAADRAARMVEELAGGQRPTTSPS